MKNTSVIKTFYALGTVNTIRIMDGASTEAAKAVMRRIKEISSKMSAFKRSSEIYELNRMAGSGAVNISYDTMTVLKRGLYFHKATRGAFNIMAQPLSELWDDGRIRRRVPVESEIEEAKSLCGAGLEIDEYNLKARLIMVGQKVGLGGIAKGYAADEAAKVLRGYGVKNALIVLGGNIWAMGGKDGGSWKVGIQNPVEPMGVTLGDVDICDETIVSSGVNEKYFVKDGVRYHHIIDPRTGRPSQTGLMSVTVIGKNSMDMDALATSAFVLGMHDGSKLIKSAGAQAIFVDSTLNVFATSGLKGKLNLKINNNKSISGEM